MNTLMRTYYTLQAIGWENLPRRVLDLLRRRLGISQRRLPGGEVPADELRRQFVADYRPDNAPLYWRQRAERFFFTPDQLSGVASALRELSSAADWHERVGQVGERLRRGQMRFFSRFYVDVGWPPQFNRDPVHKLDWPVPRHWSTYFQFDPALRDIKCIFEASRFSWAYPLAREHVRNPQAGTAELFWQLFDEWDRQNPYGLTPQWNCGQEGAFRLMAWLFAAMTTLGHAAAGARRLARLTERAWYTARHIEGNINYARSQKNNHAISEATGMMTVGLLFPELTRAEHWHEQGRRVLQAELARQIYDDGSYVQHSTNYHRVMLDDVLWAARLAEISGQPLSPTTLERVGRALAWLLHLIEPSSGRVPGYGSNDGALVLPLSTCDYTDFRPLAQAMHYLLHRTRCFEPGPWDETLLWLFGPGALDSPVRRFDRRRPLRADAGGYYALAGPRSWALIRCHSYRDRPAQADMLHLDLWFGPHNVLRDGGTYMYYCDQPWQHYFHSTAAHNTIEVDRQDQMIKGPRFLWFRWTRSRRLRFDSPPDGRVAYFEGEHYGYTRLPDRAVHRRGVLRIDDAFVILDDVLSSAGAAGASAHWHEITLRWRLCAGEWSRLTDATAWQCSLDGQRSTVSVAAPPGFSADLLCGQEQPTPEGWESLYYAEKQPAPTIRVRGSAALPIRLVTVVTPHSGEIAPVAGPPAQATEPLGLRGVHDAALRAAIQAATAGRIRAV